MANPDVGKRGAETESRMPPSGSESTGHDVGGIAKETAERARHEARQLMGEAKEKAKSALADQKGMIAEQVDSMAHALRATAHQLDEQNKGTVARYADWAADGLDRLSNSLRERDLDSIVSQVSDFARRRPAAVIGGAMVAGFLLSRFLKSSTDHGESEYRHSSEYPETGRGYHTEAGETDLNRPVTAGTIIVEEGPVGTGVGGAPSAGGSDAD